MIHTVDDRYVIWEGPAPRATRELEEHGYALVKRLFGPSEIDELRADVEAVYERCPPDVRAGHAEPEVAAQHRYEMINRSAVCQRITADRRLLDVVEPLLGPACHVIASTAWWNSPDPALAPRGQEWHTDGGPHVPRPAGVEWPESIPYPVFAVAVHVFLQEVGSHDGPTALVPGSHKSGLAPPAESKWDLSLSWRGRRSFPCHASAGDVAFFVSDVWHRRLPPDAKGKGRFFLQTNYARRDIAQRLRPTSRVNHASPEAVERAATLRERQLLGLHPENFYDG